MRYRKKPVVIDAFRWGVSEPTDWFRAAQERGEIVGFDPLVIKTLEGEMTARGGDWIIRGVKGEIYPCKPDIFLATYEQENEPEAAQP
jgi:hypothetical protein